MNALMPTETKMSMYSTDCKMFTSIKIVFVLCCLMSVITSYPFSNDPNPQECKDLIPTSIRARPQDTSTRPFKIYVSDTIYHGPIVKVTIERLGNYPIKGIMLQARRAQCDHTHQAIPLGQFLEPKETALKTMNCSGIADTIINRAWLPITRDLQLEWNNKQKDFGRLYFVATIVASDKLYWTDVTSEIIRHTSDSTEAGEICPSSDPFRSGSDKNSYTSSVLFCLSLFYCYFTLYFVSL